MIACDSHLHGEDVTLCVAENAIDTRKICCRRHPVEGVRALNPLEQTAVPGMRRVR